MSNHNKTPKYKKMLKNTINRSSSKHFNLCYSDV